MASLCDLCFSVPLWLFLNVATIFCWRCPAGPSIVAREFDILAEQLSCPEPSLPLRA